MDLSYSPEEQTFRAEVRTFLQQRLDSRLRDKVRRGQRLSKADYESWHALLDSQGWLAVTWPKAYGGTGWNAVQRHIFEEECCAAGAPRIVLSLIHI